MDTSICTGPVLQLLPQTVNVRVDAPLSQKMMEKKGTTLEDKLENKQDKICAGSMDVSTIGGIEGSKCRRIGAVVNAFFRSAANSRGNFCE